MSHPENDTETPPRTPIPVTHIAHVEHTWIFDLTPDLLKMADAVGDMDNVSILFTDRAGEMSARVKVPSDVVRHMRRLR